MAGLPPPLLLLEWHRHWQLSCVLTSSLTSDKRVPASAAVAVPPVVIVMRTEHDAPPPFFFKGEINGSRARVSCIIQKYRYTRISCIVYIQFIFPASAWRTDGPCRHRRHVDAERLARGAARFRAALRVLRRLARSRSLCARAFAQEPWWQLGGLLAGCSLWLAVYCRRLAVSWGRRRVALCPLALGQAAAHCPVAQRDGRCLPWRLPWPLPQLMAPCPLVGGLVLWLVVAEGGWELPVAMEARVRPPTGAGRAAAR